MFAKFNADGFNILWRYFAWANQTLSVFAFALIAVYMIRHKMPFLLSLIPGMFYMFVISSFILNANYGFNLSWNISYVLSGILTLAYGIAVTIAGRIQAKNQLQ